MPSGDNDSIVILPPFKVKFRGQRGPTYSVEGLAPRVKILGAVMYLYGLFPAGKVMPPEQVRSSRSERLSRQWTQSSPSTRRRKLAYRSPDYPFRLKYSGSLYCPRYSC